MKRLLSLVLTIALMLGLCLIPSSAGAEKTSTLSVMVMSDCHILAREFIADTEDFWNFMAKETKSFQDSEAIVDAQLDQVRKYKPEVLLLSGDLTKDGEYEDHVILAEKLKKLQEDVPGIKIYVTNGNHDIMNYDAYNFNTESGEQEQLTITTQELFEKAYSDITFSDDTVIARYTPPAGATAGGLSYVARPKEGYTVLVVDSCRYSADNTSDEEDEKETSGAIPEDLQAWVVEQIKAANERGDTIIGMQHHNFIPHFSMEDDILPAFVMNDWEEYATAVADAGLHYMFTGHLHSQDIARWVTDAGNEIYDIETGSAQTYPNPMRKVTFKRTKRGKTVTETVSGTTIQNLSISYVSPLTGEQVTIDDFTEYSLTTDGLLINADKLNYAAQNLISGISGLPDGTSEAVEKLVRDLCGMPMDKNATHDLVDTYNYAYTNHLAATDAPGHSNPDWYNEAMEYIESGDWLDDAFEIIVTDLAEYNASVASAVVNDLPFFPTLFSMLGLDVESTSATLLTAVAVGSLEGVRLLTPTAQEHFNNYILNILDSFNYDSNFADDKTFTLVNDWQEPKEPYQTAAVNPDRDTGTLDYLVKTIMTSIMT